MVKALALIALIALTACGQRQSHCSEVSSWAPAAFQAEAHAAEEVLGACIQVNVEPEPWPCASETGRCAGQAMALGIRVLYNEALGFGPAIGTTALEHELCHAAFCLNYGSCEAQADACAADLVAKVRARLDN